MKTRHAKRSESTARRDGPPEFSESSRSFLQLQEELAINESILMRASHLVIPTTLQKEVLNQLHTDTRASKNVENELRQSVWWPGMSRIEELVKKCSECNKFQAQRVDTTFDSYLASW